MKSNNSKSLVAKALCIVNKIYFAIHGNTVVEVIYNRANSEKENIGLTSWHVCPL